MTVEYIKDHLQFELEQINGLEKWCREQIEIGQSVELYEKELIKTEAKKSMLEILIHQFRFDRK